MSFKTAFEVAKKFYFLEWRGFEVSSPAFNGQVVHITRAGWNHITSHPRRPRAEVLQRLALFPFARQLIEKSVFVQDRRVFDHMEFWAFQGINEMGIPVRVVVRSIKGGPKHFFSVFLAVTKGHHRRYDFDESFKK